MKVIAGKTGKYMNYTDGKYIYYVHQLNNNQYTVYTKDIGSELEGNRYVEKKRQDIFYV